MNRWAGLGLGLVLLGAFASQPGVILVGALATLTAWLAGLWTRYGLRGVRYERSVLPDRAVLGDELALDVTIWNDKILPLAWLEADDFVSDGTIIRELPAVHSDRPGFRVLRNTWTLGPFEQVVRHLHVVADRRGVFELGPVRLRVADLFGRDAALAQVETSAIWLVRPRSVPVRLAARDLRAIGERRARFGLHEDPALFAGVRPYQPGDARTRIHWRATARLGQPVSRRFEPTRVHQLVIALDVQTTEPFWVMAHDEELLEGLIVAAASLTRASLLDGAACGLAAATWTGRSSRTLFVPPSADAGQFGTVSDALARMSQFASAPFELLLSQLAIRLPPGSGVIAISGRDPHAYLATELQLARSGFDVTHVAMGEHAPAWAERARRVGITAQVATLETGWRTSDALDLAG